MLRRVAGLVMLGFGLWLIWDGIRPVLLIVERGSDLGSALLSPPTSAIRIVSSIVMAFGGLLVLLSARFGATLATIGSVLFAVLGGLMAASGADSGLWMDEVLFGMGAIALSVLILTLRRA
ncbi:MAG: hypothetical protein HRT82_11580 [Henriciella sp.]|nr:hypothetical protein [Henriciella sp.]